MHDLKFYNEDSMPVEIKELVIRVAVQDSTEPVQTEHVLGNHPVSEPSVRLDSASQNELIALCVQEVLDRLERIKNR